MGEDEKGQEETHKQLIQMTEENSRVFLNTFGGKKPLFEHLTTGKKICPVLACSFLLAIINVTLPPNRGGAEMGRIREDPTLPNKRGEGRE